MRKGKVRRKEKGRRSKEKGMRKEEEGRHAGGKERRK
jgi:hypothetical protein